MKFFLCDFEHDGKIDEKKIFIVSERILEDFSSCVSSEVVITIIINKIEKINQLAILIESELTHNIY